MDTGPVCLFYFLKYFSEKSEIVGNVPDSFITGAVSPTHLEN
jgi:hypothetical protein